MIKIANQLDDALHQQSQEPASTDTCPSAESSWRNGLISNILFWCIYLAIIIGMFKNERPLFIAGKMIWLGTFLGLGWHRKQKRERDSSYRWYRFSLAELFVLATGFAFLCGFK